MYEITIGGRTIQAGPLSIRDIQRFYPEVFGGEPVARPDVDAVRKYNLTVVATAIAKVDQAMTADLLEESISLAELPKALDDVCQASGLEFKPADGAASGGDGRD